MDQYQHSTKTQDCLIKKPKTHLTSTTTPQKSLRNLFNNFDMKLSQTLLVAFAAVALAAPAPNANKGGGYEIILMCYDCDDSYSQFCCFKELEGCFFRPCNVCINVVSSILTSQARALYFLFCRLANLLGEQPHSSS